MKIPMSSPDITAVEVEAVNQVLQTPSLSNGPRIVGFEESFSSYLGVSCAIGVSGGTAGLHLSLIASGVGEGDLVITTPFSFVASANVILYEGATPIFVDIDPNTLNIDPVQLTEVVEDLVCLQPSSVRRFPPSLRDQLSSVFRPPTLVLPVHTFGQPADMDAVLKVAREHNLAVIEDACEALGAEYKGRKAGTLGDCGVFGFYPNKQITTGEGGMIVTNRGEWDSLFRSLRNQGRDTFDAWLNHKRLGYNYRLDEMSAALGLAQLGRIDDLLANRQQVADWYNERLTEVQGLRPPYVAPTTTRTSWFVFVVRLDLDINRNVVMALLEEKGIPSRPYFTPIHLQPFYQERFGYRQHDFPVTEAVARSTLALPFFGTMREEQVEYVCENLVSALLSQEVRA